MEIGHIGIFTDDLEGMKGFWLRHFDASAEPKYHNAKTLFSSYFLTLSSGARVEIMTRPGLVRGDGDAVSTGLAHIAISLGSAEAVDAKTHELAEDGCTLLAGPRITGDGYYESLLKDPWGNMLELTI